LNTGGVTASRTVLRIVGGYVLTTSALVAGCSTSSSGGRPWIVCGTTLYSGAAGIDPFTVFDKSNSIAPVGANGNAYLVLSDDCRRGAAVSFPSGDAAIVKEAVTSDGTLAAIVLEPLAHTVSVIVTTSDRGRHIVHLITEPATAAAAAGS
jgi:hypothetical protein